MNYLIKHGQQPGKQLTTAQRTSSKFAEEPVVMGKVFRKALKALKITQEQYSNNLVNLMRLREAGAITIDTGFEETLIEEEIRAITESLKNAPLGSLEITGTSEGLEDLSNQVESTKVELEAPIRGEITDIQGPEEITAITELQRETQEMGGYNKELTAPALEIKPEPEIKSEKKNKKGKRE